MSAISNKLEPILTRDNQGITPPSINSTELSKRTQESAHKILDLRRNSTTEYGSLSSSEVKFHESLVISPEPTTGIRSPLSITESPQSARSNTSYKDASPLSTAKVDQLNSESEAALNLLQPEIDRFTDATQKATQILAIPLNEISKEEEELLAKELDDLDNLKLTDPAALSGSSLSLSSTKSTPLTEDSPTSSAPLPEPIQSFHDLRSRFDLLKSETPLSLATSRAKTTSETIIISEEAKTAFLIVKKSHPSERELRSITVTRTFIDQLKRIICKLPSLKNNRSLQLKIIANLQRAIVFKNMQKPLSQQKIIAEIKKIDTKLCKLLSHIFAKPHVEQPSKIQFLINILYPLQGAASEAHQAMITEAVGFLLAGPDVNLHSRLLLLVYNSIKSLPLSDQYKLLGLITASFTEIGILGTAPD